MADDKDGVELRDDGTIGLHMCGASYVLRRPTVGEMRGLHEAADEAERVFGERDRKFTAMYADDGPWSAWLEQLVAVLNGGTLPAAAERPSWTSSYELPRQLLTHWREVPLVRGSAEKR